MAGFEEADLKQMPGSEARKVALARLIWEQTTMDLKWIAEHLALRSAPNASQQIRRQREQPPNLPKPLEIWIAQ